MHIRMKEGKSSAGKSSAAFSNCFLCLLPAEYDSNNKMTVYKFV